MINSRKTKQHPGAVTIILVLALTGIVLTALLSITVLATSQIGQTGQLAGSDRTYFAAEAGLQKTLFLLRTNSLPTVPDETINGATVSVTVTLQPGFPYNRILTATAVNPDGQKRTVRLTAVTTTYALANNFAVQAGAGGIIVNNGSRILGDVFSNGSIVPAGNGQSGTVLPDPTNLFPGNTTVASAGNRIEQMTISGDAWADTLQGSNANPTTIALGKFAKYQSISGRVRAGSETCTTGITSAHCLAGQVPAAPLSMPIQDSDIAAWRSELQNAVTGSMGSGGQTLNGNQSVSSSATWPTTKINGNLTVSSNNTVLTLNGPLWVTGTLTINNNAKIIASGNLLIVGNINLANNATVTLNPSLGEDDGIMITDGRITIDNGVTLSGSGNAKSSLALLTTNNVVNESQPSISAANTSVGVIYYAKDGLVRVAPGGNLNAVLANKVYLDNNATVSFSPSIQFFTVPNPSPSPITVQNGTWEEL